MKKALLSLAGVAVLAVLVVLGIRRGDGDKGTGVYAEAAARRDIAKVVGGTGASRFVGGPLSALP